MLPEIEQPLVTLDQLALIVHQESMHMRGDIDEVRNIILDVEIDFRKRFGVLENRFDGLEQRIGVLEEKFDIMLNLVQCAYPDIRDIKQHGERMEGSLSPGGEV